MKPSEVLERAKHRLLTTGWKQGGDGPPEGPNCLNGAIRWADRGWDAPTTHAAARCLIEVINEHHGYWTVIGFNDSPDTTKDDALSALDRAIQLARAREAEPST